MTASTGTLATTFTLNGIRLRRMNVAQLRAEQELSAYLLDEHFTPLPDRERIILAQINAELARRTPWPPVAA